MDGITDLMDMSLSKLQEMLKDRKPGVLRHGVAKSWTRLIDSTLTRGHCLPISFSLLTGGLKNPASFSLGGREDSRGVFVSSVSFRGKLLELRICGTLVKQACCPDASLRILKSLESPVSWCILAAVTIQKLLQTNQQ